MSARRTHPRVLVVAIDAFEVTRLHRFLADGRLPNLAAYLGGVPELPVTSDGATFHGALWPTFASGADPGHHGRYWWAQYLPDEGRVVRNDHPAFDYVPFWVHLAEAGYRVISLDVPYVPLVDHERVWTAVGWGSHDELTPGSAPGRLLPAIVRRYGRHPLQFDTMHAFSARSKIRLARDMRRGMAARVRLIEDMAARRDWNLCILHCSEMHKAGHYLAEPERLPGNTDNESLLASIIEPLDAAWPRIVAAAGDDCTIVFLALHGMRELHDWAPLGERAVRLAEGLDPEPPPMKPDLIRRVRDLLPTAVSDAIWERVPARVRAGRFASTSFQAVDPAAPVIVLPVDAAIALRLRIAGRDPGGVLTATEAVDLLDRIEATVAEFRTETGAPAFAPMVRAQERYPGPRSHLLPDALIPANAAERKVSAIERPGGPRFENDVAEIRNGMHTGRGFAYVVPGSGASRPWKGELETRDFAPTFLDLFGVAAPAHFEGKSALS